VSSNLARRVLNDLQQYQEVRRGSIGLADVVPVTTRIANELSLSDTKGALVYSIYRNSPALQAGIRQFDVVVTFNGTTVEDPGHLSRLISDARIGSTATVGVIREGRRVELKVTIGRTGAR
jgi:serine protease Do